MLQWLSSLFVTKPPRVFGPLTEAPRQVFLEARVASPNTQKSPLTGTTAAVIMVTVVEREIIQTQGNRGAGGPEVEQFFTVGSTLLGESLDLVDADGVVVRVPVAGGVAIRALFNTGGNTLSTVPDFLKPIVARTSGQRVVCFREVAFREGDVVQFRGMVALETTASAEGYRSGVGQRAVVRPELGRAEIAETLG
jgi:hypothetical protein